MTYDKSIDLAEHYLLEDVPGAKQTGARLHGILMKIDAGEPLSRLAGEFLSASGLYALKALSDGEIGRATFRQNAEMERAKRVEQTAIRVQEKAADEARAAAQRKAAVKALFTERANDPKLRRQKEAKELRQRFGMGYIEPEHYPRVMGLLRSLSAGKRLQPEDIVWLKTEADDCWTAELERAWHISEAEALSVAWQKRADPWDAINASSHWRKADEPARAVLLTKAAKAKVGANKKARSALATTCGGALRDLHRREEAKALAIEAHHLTPADFRPCTLAGAVFMELGDLAAGHSWYAKAETLGADRLSVDQDLLALIASAPKSEQQRIREFLLKQDPERFSWLQR
jgi:hypothetical protein